MVGVVMSIRFTVYNSPCHPSVTKQRCENHAPTRISHALRYLCWNRACRSWGNHCNAFPRRLRKQLGLQRTGITEAVPEFGVGSTKARTETLQVFAKKMCLWNCPQIPMGQMRMNVLSFTTQPWRIKSAKMKQMIIKMNLRSRVWCFPNSKQPQYQHSKEGPRSRSPRCQSGSAHGQLKRNQN